MSASAPTPPGPGRRNSLLDQVIFSGFLHKKSLRGGKNLASTLHPRFFVLTKSRIVYFHEEVQISNGFMAPDKDDKGEDAKSKEIPLGDIEGVMRGEDEEASTLVLETEHHTMLLKAKSAEDAAFWADRIESAARAARVRVRRSSEMSDRTRGSVSEPNAAEEPRSSESVLTGLSPGECDRYIGSWSRFMALFGSAEDAVSGIRLLSSHLVAGKEKKEFYSAFGMLLALLCYCDRTSKRRLGGGSVSDFNPHELTQLVLREVLEEEFAVGVGGERRLRRRGSEMQSKPPLRGESPAAILCGAYLRRYAHFSGLLGDVVAPCTDLVRGLAPRTPARGRRDSTGRTLTHGFERARKFFVGTPIDTSVQDHHSFKMRTDGKVIQPTGRSMGLTGLLSPRRSNGTSSLLSMISPANANRRASRDEDESTPRSAIFRALKAQHRGPSAPSPRRAFFGLHMDPDAASGRERSSTIDAGIATPLRRRKGDAAGGRDKAASVDAGIGTPPRRRRRSSRNSFSSTADLKGKGDDGGDTFFGGRQQRSSDVSDGYNLHPGNRRPFGRQSSQEGADPGGAGGDQEDSFHLGEPPGRPLSGGRDAQGETLFEERMTRLRHASRSIEAQACYLVLGTLDRCFGSRTAPNEDVPDRVRDVFMLLREVECCCMQVSPGAGRLGSPPSSTQSSAQPPSASSAEPASETSESPPFAKDAVGGSERSGAAAADGAGADEDVADDDDVASLASARAIESLVRGDSEDACDSPANAPTTPMTASPGSPALTVDTSSIGSGASTPELQPKHRFSDPKPTSVSSALGTHIEKLSITTDVSPTEVCAKSSVTHRDRKELREEEDVAQRCYNGIGLLIFLRWICPAIISPCEWGVYSPAKAIFEEVKIESLLAGCIGVVTQYLASGFDNPISVMSPTAGDETFVDAFTRAKADLCEFAESVDREACDDAIACFNAMAADPKSFEDARAMREDAVREELVKITRFVQKVVNEATKAPFDEDRLDQFRSPGVGAATNGAGALASSFEARPPAHGRSLSQVPRLQGVGHSRSRSAAALPRALPPGSARGNPTVMGLVPHVRDWLDSTIWRIKNTPEEWYMDTAGEPDGRLSTSPRDSGSIQAAVAALAFGGSGGDSDRVPSPWSSLPGPAEDYAFPGRRPPEPAADDA
uniref:PH domain-containing protein n=1 Tax=Phaeomonas parva TaxID=124430 RepID=A0A7S1UEP2_9STRA|mmetsp:Transcript_43870/g.137857  ORF Transcript_43870/g.137857 Transcript_43870/m.137857 type:complete len:1161 (+) Transcript_43870:156-3638(+)